MEENNMKNVKKLLAMLLAVSMVMSMAACGTSSTGTSSVAENATTSTADTADTTDTTDDTETAEAADTTTASGTAFKLGGIGPLTGGAAIYGTAAMNGAQIAVDEINALGGDIQFEFNAQDDVHDAETSVNAYHTLQDWGMQVLVGTVTTAPCIAVSAEAYNDRVFCLTPSASSTDVIDNKDNMFQVCFTDPNQGTGAADYIAENISGTIAVIYQNDDAYSQGIRDTFVAEAADKGLEVVYEGTFTNDTATDFSVQLTAAQAAGAEIIFLPIYYQPASIILKQADSMGYAPTFFGVDGMDGILTLENFDTSLAEGVMLLTPFSADAEDEKTQNFVSKYQELYGETPNQFAADGYDAVYVIYEAIQAAGCTADMSAADICEALIAVMPTISVDGLTGEGMTWDETGAVSKAPRAVVIKDGVYVTP
jgi:branched-chain amino acid transport system substrate-binding protein